MECVWGSGIEFIAHIPSKSLNIAENWDLQHKKNQTIDYPSLSFHAGDGETE